MKIEENFYNSKTKHKIYRKSFLPENKIQNGLLIVHGIGEHTSRYENQSNFFTKKGFFCCGVDLPGFGKSDGKRGDISDFSIVVDILDETLKFIKSKIPSSAKIGILGHSMGALFTLGYIWRRKNDFDFAWISSPLIEPMYNVNKLNSILLPLIGKVFPHIVISTPVNPPALSRDKEEIKKYITDPLIHNKMSLGLGLVVISEAKQLFQNQLAKKLKLIITHGSKDILCPPKYSKKYFDYLDLKNKQYTILDGFLHETFNDIGKEKVYEILDEWYNKYIK